MLQTACSTAAPVESKMIGSVEDVGQPAGQRLHVGHTVRPT